MTTVADIQLALIARGESLAVDGDMGPMTRAAIMRVIQRVAPTLVELDDARPVVMSTSAAGRAAIAQREGNVLKAYRDSVGVLTIGVGHTSAAGAPTVAPGMTITAAQSDEILSRDLATFERAVREAVKVPLKQHEFDALVSLAFNIGGGAFAKSTLVKKLNAGDRTGAANAFLSWNRAGGKVLKGLTTRREAERKQFFGE